MRALGANDRREVIAAAAALGIVLMVVVGLWFALLDQNNRFGISPDAVLDLEFGHESLIPDDATLTFAEDIASDPQWVRDGSEGSYRHTVLPCTVSFRESFVDPSDVRRGDDRATTLSFIATETEKTISASDISDATFDLDDNGTVYDAAASAVYVQWREPDGSLYSVQARANGVRGQAVMIVGRCAPDPENALGFASETVIRATVSSVTVTLEHDARPPNLFTPYEG